MAQLIYVQKRLVYSIIVDHIRNCILQVISMIE